MIELLLVIGIIGILVTLFILYNVQIILMKGRDSQRKANITSIQLALEQYRSDNGEYPISQTDNTFLNNVPCNEAFLSPTSVRYLQTIPCDPKLSEGFNSGNYYYYSADGKHYVIAGCLENEKDEMGSAKTPAGYYTELYPNN